MEGVLLVLVVLALPVESGTRFVMPLLKEAWLDVVDISF